ncbi:YhfC family glutamic-type intramembrane protease [Frisingicoccus sp.]|uniref:YhfC family intramembrane metalloprotease n=1 Tax=Frisingicoccus sp. TaxID=1918627 RepID=UPI0015B9DA96
MITTAPLIPQTSLFAMGFTGVLCIAVPIVLLIVFKNRFRVKAAPFFFGVITFIIFAIVLESFAHEYFLSGTTGLSQAILNNPFLYAIYGGLAAGIFEEFGRFFCMLTVMKRFMYQKENSIIYGIGHGGMEAIFIGAFTMLQNLMVAVVLNDYGSVEAYAGQSGSAEGAKVVTDLLNTLIDTPASAYILSGIERMAALVLQIALSVLVYKAVIRKKYAYILVPIVLHALIDVIAAFYQTGLVTNLLLLEAIVIIYAIAVAIYAYRQYHLLSYDEY